VNKSTTLKMASSGIPKLNKGKVSDFVFNDKPVYNEEIERIKKLIIYKSKI
jgi:hypothetical protein